MPMRTLYSRFRATDPPALGASLQMTAGEDLAFIFAADAPVSLAGWSVTFSVRPADGSSTLSVAKTVGSGIVLTDPVNGVLIVSLASVDTSVLTLQTTPWVWDLARTDTGNAAVLAKGTMGIAAGAPASVVVTGVWSNQPGTQYSMPGNFVLGQIPALPPVA